MAPRISERAADRSDRRVLCAVLDAQALGGGPGSRAAELFEAGVDWIQLRDRALGGADAARIADALVSAARALESDARVAGRRLRVFVNRRVDVAWAVGADGVHLGFDGVATHEARRLLGPDAILGRAFHTLDEVRRAAGPRRDATLASDRPDHGQLAPIWDPVSKPARRPALGPERLAEAAACGLPLLAQGGLDAERAAVAIRAGAFGVAVTGRIAGDGPGLPETRALRAALDEAGTARPTAISRG